MDPDGLSSMYDLGAAIALGAAAALAAFIIGWVLAKKLTLPPWLDRALARAGLGNRDTMTEEEFLEMVDDADEEQIDESKKEMISNIFELDDVCAGDIMTHRMDMVAVEEAAPCRQVVAAALESGNSRLPVYRKTVDDVVGIIYVKDLLRLVDHPEEQDSAITRTAGAARLSPWRLARGWAKTNITRLLMEPRMTKVTSATRKTRFTWFRRSRALASEMVLDMATGRPAVEIISSRL